MIKVNVFPNASKYLESRGLNVRPLIEGLKPEEKKEVNTWTSRIPHPFHPGDESHHLGHMFTDHVFAGSKDPHRITLPLAGDAEKHSDVRYAVDSHVRAHGYTISDYINGVASKPGQRQVSLKKLLAPGGAAEDPHISHKYSTDTTRLDRRKNYADDHVVTITRHPHEVAGMSACDHPWESCLNFKDGSHKQSLLGEVKQGTMVAYMHHKDDKKIEKPLGRVAIRPFTDGDEGRIYRAEHPTNVYGKTAAGKLHATAHEWAEKNFPAEKGKFYGRVGTTYNEYPGTAAHFRHGDVDLENAHTEDAVKFISAHRGHPMKSEDYDTLVHRNDSEIHRELADKSGGPNMENLKRNLGHIAKHTPDALLGSAALANTSIDATHTHTYEHPETGKLTSVRPHEVLDMPASHAERAVPGIKAHIKTIAKNGDPYTHEKLLKKLDKSVAGSVLHDCKDDIHTAVNNQMVAGNSNKSEKQFNNMEKSFSMTDHSGMSKPTYDKVVGFAKASEKSHKPGKSRFNWAHHITDVHNGDSRSKDSFYTDAARDAASSMRDHPHFDSKTHGPTIDRLQGKTNVAK